MYCVANRILKLTALVLLTTGCADKGASGPKVQSASFVSGGGQTGVVGTELNGPIVAVVVDAVGNALAGVEVHFSSPDPVGRATPAAVVSDANGLVQTTWTLGGPKGTQTLNASVEGQSSPAVITATALQGDPVSVRIFSGDSQSTVINTALRNPLKVIYQDVFSNGVEGVAVTYSGVDGNGQPTSAPASLSGADGVASTTWVLHAIGAQTLVAHSGGKFPLDITLTGFGRAQ
jgi:hypothetical protein